MCHFFQQSSSKDHFLEFDQTPTYLLPKRNGPVVPLPLHRIFAARGFNSQSTLFRLPFEILQQIFDEADSGCFNFDYRISILGATADDLGPKENFDIYPSESYHPSAIAGLARVSRDCYEIARAYQWFRLSFVPSKTFSHLARRLLTEIPESNSARNSELTTLPNVIQLIRGIEVFEETPYAEHRHNGSSRNLKAGGVRYFHLRRHPVGRGSYREGRKEINSLVNLTCTENESSNRLSFSDGDSDFSIVQSVLAKLLKAGPENLHLLSLGNTQELDKKIEILPTLLQTILERSIPCIYLAPGCLDGLTSLMIPQRTPSGQVNKLTLKTPTLTTNTPSTHPNFGSQYLSLCLHWSSTLTYLNLAFRTPISSSFISPNGSSHFPMLDTLIMSVDPGLLCKEVLQVFFPKKRNIKLRRFHFTLSFRTLCDEREATYGIRSLHNKIPRDDIIEEFFGDLGCVPSLRELYWSYSCTSATINFLETNPQLKKVSIQLPESNKTYISTVPLMANVTKLHIKVSAIVPGEVFQIVGTLTMLEHLEIDGNVGNFFNHYCHRERYYHRSVWKAEHEQIIQPSLQHLHYLRYLWFGHDAYDQIHRFFHSGRNLPIEILPPTSGVAFDDQSSAEIKVNGIYYGDCSSSDKDQYRDYDGNEPDHPAYDAIGWEQDHALRMLRTAQGYFEQHARLEKVHVGGITTGRILVIPFGCVYARDMAGQTIHNLSIVDKSL
ncbi:hypothetical protein EJ08DRAFT_701432 [Tothia fuscella]|uniref:F-box domain-containing protein n=1 Tax=Tothia fuscella TaxID=1048955 RepID=A0A9P4NII8_9PEZI|nr:hypothetical protein EJ08DRAFT_701432 [Tothia fuscella]